MEFKDHPSYAEKAEDWKVYRDLFEGKHSTLAEQYLILHRIEKSALEGSVALLQTRRERSFYTNHASRIFKRYTGLLFQNGIQLDDETIRLFDEYGAQEDIDGQGNSLEEFIKRSLFKDRFLYGQCYLLTDSTKAEPKERTKAQRKAENIRPFWKMLSPLAVKDWQFYQGGPEMGKLQGVRAEFAEMQQRATLEEAGKIIEGYYLYQMIDSTYVVSRYIKVGDTKESKLVLDESFPISGIDKLPIATIKEIDSYLKDVEPHTRKVYNLDSNISNILHHQGYQDRALIGNIEKKTVLAQGEFVNNIFPVGTEIVVTEPVYPQGSMEERNRAEGEVWKTAFHLTRMMPADSKDGEAADTLDKQREDLKAFIVTELQSIENLLNKGLQHFAMFAGEPSFQGKITLDKNVDLTNFAEELQAEIAYAEDIKQVPTWRKSVLKKRAREMQVENIEEIEKEIDALKQEQPTPERVANEVLANA
jgi:hypothetical protein